MEPFKLKYFFKVTDLKDAERRIVDMRCKMVIRGIHSEPANGPLVAGDYGSSACPVEFNAKYKPDNTSSAIDRHR